MSVVRIRHARVHFLNIEVMVLYDFFDLDYFGDAENYTEVTIRVEQELQKLAVLNVDNDLLDSYIEYISELQASVSERFLSVVKHIVLNKYKVAQQAPGQRIYYDYRLLFSLSCDCLFKSIMSFCRKINIEVILPSKREIDEIHLPFTQENFELCRKMPDNLQYMGMIKPLNSNDFANIFKVLEIQQDILAREYIPELPIIEAVQAAKQKRYMPISAGTAEKLHHLFTTDRIIEDIEYLDFFECFDLNNIPSHEKMIKPTNGNTVTLLYALKKIQEIKPEHAEQNFGITNYGSRAAIPGSQKVTIMNKIDAIFKRQ